MLFTTLILYALLVSICQANTPFFGPHPSIETGRVMLILQQNYLTSFFMNTYYLSSDLSYHKAYKIPLSISFAQTPKASLGIYSIQYDSSHFSTPDFDLGLTAQNQTTSSIGIRVRNMNNSYNFLKSLGVTYICVIKSDVPQIIFFARIGGIQTDPILGGTPANYLKTMTYNRSYQTVATSSSLKGWILLAGFCIQSTNRSYISLQYRQYSSSMFQIIISTNNQATLRILTVYAIVIDLGVSNPKYKFYNQTKIIGTNTANNFFSTLSLQNNQYFVGISKIYAVQSSSSTVGFQIIFDQGGSIKQFNKFEQIWIQYLRIAVLQCPNNLFYFPRNNSCVTECIDGNSLQNRYCLTCVKYCTLCIDNTTCQTCLNEYYLLDQYTCQSCSTFSYGCTKCSLDYGCTQCDTNGLFASPNPTCQCVANSQRESDQEDCKCITQYYQQQGECIQCSVLCKQCNGSQSDNCLECDNEIYRQQSGTSCVCKQSFVQLCDETTASGGNTGGNTSPGGVIVSTTTKSSSSNCNPSVCYLDPTIQFKFNISLQKDPISNTLKYSINIQPNLSFLNQLDFNKIINLGLPSSTDIKSSYENGLLIIYANYKQGINNLQTVLNFSLLSTGSLSFSQTQNILLNYSVTPINLPADTYTEQQYALSKYLKYFTYALVGLSLLVFIFGLYSSKLVVLQMMAVLQVSFFGLFLLQFNNPFVFALFPLRYTNGFNDIFNKSQGITPNRIYLTGYDQQILNNINIMSILIVLPLFFALLFFTLSKNSKHQKKKYMNYFKLCIGQWCLSSILFSLYNMSVSVGVLASYITITTGWKFLLGILEICIDFSIGIFSFVLYALKDYNYLGQFKYMFRWASFELNYYYFHIGLRILFGILLAVMSMFYWTGAIVSFGLFAIALVTAITRPYADILHSVRSTINLVFSSIIMLIYTLIASNPSNPNYYKLPIIIIIALLFLTVFMALGFIIRQIKKDIQTLKQLQQSAPVVSTLEQQQKIYEQFMKKQIQQAKNGQKNFVNKLFLANNKKKRRKVNPPLIQNNQSQTNRSVVDEAIEEQDNGLTVQRFKKVDEMLKDGLV